MSIRLLGVNSTLIWCCLICCLLPMIGTWRLMKRFPRHLFNTHSIHYRRVLCNAMCPIEFVNSWNATLMLATTQNRQLQYFRKVTIWQYIPESGRRDLKLCLWWFWLNGQLFYDPCAAVSWPARHNPCLISILGASRGTKIGGTLLSTGTHSSNKDWTNLVARSTPNAAVLIALGQCQTQCQFSHHHGQTIIEWSSSLIWCTRNICHFYTFTNVCTVHSMVTQITFIATAV